MQLIVFRIQQVDDPYLAPNIDGDSNPDFVGYSLDYKPTDWPPIESYELSDLLNRQAKYTQALFTQQSEQCRQTKRNSVACRRFLQAQEAYEDVFTRDMFALGGNLDIETYAVVLTDNEEYYGHIYTWVSPTNPDRCLMMGIRNRVDTSFLREDNVENYIAGVASLLVEGVRRFATSKGCRQISVVLPFGVIVPILKSLGFTDDPYPSSEVGSNSVAFLDGPDDNEKCDYCLSLNDVLTPVARPDHLDFHLIE